MKKYKRSIFVYMIVVFVLVLVGCGDIKKTPTNVLKTLPKEEDNEFLHITEMDVENKISDPVEMNLSEYEEEILIEKGGEYLLSGSSYWPVRIDAHDENVHLFLDNVNIETTTGPALEIISGGKVVITLIEDSINTFFDSAYYSNKDLNATISSECDLTINGSGTMYVSGVYKDAIHSKDVLKILDGQVQVKSKRYGLKGNDGILLSADAVIIESEKNGCQTSNADKEGKGIIDIRGGNVSIVAGEYALSAVADVYIRDGYVNMNSVIADIYAEGQQYIAEGIVNNE